MAGATVRLVIVGAGGHGRETLDIIETANHRSTATGDGLAYDLLGFVADSYDADLLARRRTHVIGRGDDLVELLRRPGYEDVRFHLGIGSGAARARLDEDLTEAGLGDRAESLVHADATLGSDLRVGAGVYLAAGARVTTNVTLGRHTHLNVNAVVSHDSTIGDHVTLSPGVLVNGNVTIGDRTMLGTGAIVLPGRTIGADATIGAGAVVSRDVPDGVTAMGVPARWS